MTGFGERLIDSATELPEQPTGLTWALAETAPNARK
jgi:hypothetical protein